MLDQLNRAAFRLPSLKAIRNMSPIAWREMKAGLTFLAPWIIGFIAFTFLPIIASLIFSFMDLRITDGILSTPEFVGLDNYARLFSDPQIWTGEGGTRGSLWITVRFGLIALPVGILAPLGWRSCSTTPT
ncbi:MAG: sugar ABC transporter permease [Chloroflexi bacterium]|nr:sugar ABC transporter permease [Chloroflexota bacterium]